MASPKSRPPGRPYRRAGDVIDPGRGSLSNCTLRVSHILFMLIRNFVRFPRGTILRSSSGIVDDLPAYRHLGDMGMVLGREHYGRPASSPSTRELKGDLVNEVAPSSVPHDRDGKPHDQSRGRRARCWAALKREDHRTIPVLGRNVVSCD